MSKIDDLLLTYIPRDHERREVILAILEVVRGCVGEKEHYDGDLCSHSEYFNAGEIAGKNKLVDDINSKIGEL